MKYDPLKLAIVESVAAGLRAMSVKPDAFLFIDGLADMEWNEPNICGLPVFHSAGFLPPHQGSESVDCLFVPIWAKEIAFPGVESQRFVRSYCRTFGVEFVALRLKTSREARDKAEIEAQLKSDVDAIWGEY